MLTLDWLKNIKIKRIDIKVSITKANVDSINNDFLYV